MKVVLFCGGLGTRIRDFSENIPKPMIPVGGRPIHAYFELHIEQGPILEAEDIEIGVVTGIQGAYWFDVALTGASAHAGPTPMAPRM